jgi:hypothetical protein
MSSSATCPQTLPPLQTLDCYLSLQFVRSFTAQNNTVMPHLLTQRAVVPNAVDVSRHVIELHCTVECDKIQYYKLMLLKSVNNGENVWRQFPKKMFSKCSACQINNLQNPGQVSYNGKSAGQRQDPQTTYTARVIAECAWCCAGLAGRGHSPCLNRL